MLAARRNTITIVQHCVLPGSSDWPNELLFTGRHLDAEGCYEVGLLNQLTDAAKLEEAGLGMAQEIAQNPPDAVRAIKALLDQGIGTPLIQRFYRELYSNRERGAGATAQRAFKSFATGRSTD